MIFELPKIKAGDGIKSGDDWYAVYKVSIVGLFLWNLNDDGIPIKHLVLRNKIPEFVSELFRAGDIVWKRPKNP